MINIVNSYDEKARELYKNCDIYYNRNIFIAKSIPSDNECIKSRLHSHNEYEFFIPNSPIPFLVNEDSIFFGEIGYIYTAKSNQKHGIKYNLSNIDYTSILIDTDYLKNIMQELKCSDNLFNHPIYLSRELKFYLHIFQDEFKKGDKKGIRVKKNNPEVILKYNDINYAVLCDVLIGLCLELAVLWMYKMTIYMLPSVEE